MVDTDTDGLSSRMTNKDWIRDEVAIHFPSCYRNFHRHFPPETDLVRDSFDRKVKPAADLCV